MTKITYCPAGYAIGYVPNGNVCKVREIFMDSFVPRIHGGSLTSTQIDATNQARYLSVKAMRNASCAALESRARGKRDPKAERSLYR